MGIPTVLICTEAFVPLARAEAKAMGLPDMRIVSIPHPLGGLFEERVRERARSAVPAIIEALGIGRNDE
ncbi:MAG: hypothetical protein HYX92_18170 [Chloroflexi bacterium]|nr:hypothetical protein [Chloroflexota bacterium]